MPWCQNCSTVAVSVEGAFCDVCKEYVKSKPKIKASYVVPTEGTAKELAWLWLKAGRVVRITETVTNWHIDILEDSK